MTGRIHSIESFGTVDGPGIRLVVFFQGCPMRCLYCHNPDTWNPQGGHEISVEQILRLYQKNKSFYRNGGITATGGEPLMQLKFLTELFQSARRQKIHTCLDTSGITYSAKKVEKIDQLLDVTDLVLLDLKHISPQKHQDITGHSNKNVLDFLSHLNQRGIPVWIRHVLVPGLTDDSQSLYELGRQLAPYRCIQVLDVLPYHTMGKSKYQELGLSYPLGDTPEATEEQAKAARREILLGIRENR